MFLASRLAVSGCCILGLGIGLNNTAIFASSKSFSTPSSMGCSASSHDDSWKSAKSIYDFKVLDIGGNEVDLRERYEDKVVLIVNVASE